MMDFREIGGLNRARFSVAENMCLPKVTRGLVLADGRRRGDPERLAKSERRERGDGIARAIAEIRRTAGAHSEEHRGRERSGERLRLEQRHRFSCFAGETRRSQHQVDQLPLNSSGYRVVALRGQEVADS